MEIAFSRAAQAADLLEDAVAALSGAGIETAFLDAEVMLCAALGCDRVALITGRARIDDAGTARFRALVARRAAREPLAYILGRREFYALEFEVTPAVLIPRAETELLVDRALITLSGRASTILDLGTGSGAIAVAIAVNAPRARIAATDISPLALATAHCNALRHACRERVTLVRSDCFEGLARRHQFDLIVSNPPYVAHREQAELAPELAFEPRIALDGGSDGLDFYRRIGAQAHDYLRPEGTLMVEVGWRRASAVMAILAASGCCTTAVLRDLAGHSRVVCARRAA